ncbi:MAG: hypothetical protein RIT45_934 [Pseudomonadota bacterium]|jgi:hypothetical protein
MIELTLPVPVRPAAPSAVVLRLLLLTLLASSSAYGSEDAP